MKTISRFRRVLPYLVLIPTIIAGAVLLQFLYDRLQILGRTIQTSVGDLVKAKTGLTINYDRMGPNVFKSLDIDNFRLIRPDGSTVFVARKVQISYKPLELIAGRYLEAIGALELDDFLLDFDLVRDAQVLAAFAPTDQKAGPTLPTFQDIADAVQQSLNEGSRLTLSRGRLRLAAAGQLFEASIQDLRGQRQGEKLLLETGRIDLAHQGGGGTKDLQLALNFQASYSRSARVAFGELHVDQIQFPGLSIRPQSIGFSWFPDRVTVQKVGAQEAIDIRGEYAFETQTLEAQLVSQSYPIGALVDLPTADNALLAAIGAMPVDMNLHWSWRLGQGTMNYEGTIASRIVSDQVGLVALNLALKGDERILEKANLEVHSPLVDLTFQGGAAIPDWSVHGLLQASSGVLGPPLVLSAHLGGNQRAMALVADSCTLGGVPIPVLRFDAQPTDGRAQGRIEIGSQNKVTLGINLNFGSQIQADAALESQAFPVMGPESPLPALLTQNGLGDFFSSEAVFTASARLTLVDGLLRSAQVRQLTLDDPRQNRHLGLSLTASQDRFSISQLALNIPGFKLDGTAELNQTATGSKIASSLVVNDQKLDFKGEASSDLRHYELTGSSGLYIAGGIVDNVAVTTFRLESYPIPLPQNQARLSAVGTLTLPLRGLNWQLSLFDATFEIQGLLPGYRDAYSKISLAGQMNRQEIAVTSLSYTDPIGLLTGSGRGRWTEATKAWDYQLALAGAAGAGGPPQITSQGHLSPDAVDATFELLNLPLARLNNTGWDLAGQVNVKGTVGGSLNDPVVLGQIATSGAAMNGAGLNLGANFKISQSVIAATKVEGHLLQHHLSIPDFVFDPKVGLITAHASYMQDLWAEDRAVPISLRLFLPRLVPDPQRISEVSVKNLAFSPTTRSELNLRGEEGTLGWSWTEANKLMGFFIRRGDNRLSLATQAPFPVTCNAEGFVRGSDLDITVTRLSLSVKPLSPDLKWGIYQINDGTLSGDIRVVGPIVDPSFFGTLKASNYDSTLSICPFPIKAKTGYLVFEDKEMNLLPVTASAGDTTAEVSATFVISRQAINQYSILVNVTEAQGLPIKASFGPVGVNGRARGTIRIAGLNNRTEITGTLETLDTTISNVDTGPEKKVDPNAPLDDNDLRLSLTVTTGRNVEFVWPRAELPIVQSFFDRNQVVQLNYRSRPVDFQIDGNVTLRGGNVFYSPSNFNIREASMILHERGGEFNPRVNLLAELQTSYNNTRYRITYRVRDNRLSELKPTIESVPNNLTLVQLEQALGRLQTNDPDGRLDASTVTLLTGEVLVRLPILRSFENFVRNLIQADVFSVRSGLVPNLLTTALIPSSTVLDNQTLSLGKYFDNTSILIGKYFGPSMYGEALLQISSTNPIGLATQQQSSNFVATKPDGSVYFVPEFSMDWAITPYLDMRWDFKPKNKDVLYLTDHTLTFTLTIK